MSENEKKATVWLRRADNYQFNVTTDFPEDWQTTADEPPELGDGKGVSPSRLLGAAIGHCLAASLLFCLEKSRAKLDGEVEVEVEITIRRNERSRWRIERADVKLHLPEMDEAQQKAFQRCSTLFEDFCIVTASVREGIEVNVDLVTA